MRTIFKSALVACAALTVGLVGCQKDNGTGTSDGQTVTIQLLQDEAAGGTRAPGVHVDGNTAVTMEDATIYFTNGTNDIISYITIDFATPSSPYNKDTKKVGLQTAKEGFSVTGLPGAVNKAVIVGNLPAGVPYLTTGNISGFAAITVESQYAANQGVKEISLYGEGILAEVDGPGNENKRTVTVSIAPVSARLEVGKISAGGTNNKIKSFVLDGIYVNNYYPSMAISGLTAADIQNWMGSGYNDTNYDLNGRLSDTGTNLVKQTPSEIIWASKATAGAGDVWGYNVLAPDSDPATTANTFVAPHIVIRITNVVVTGASGDDTTTYAGTKWLTVRNLKDGANVLAFLDRGTAYRIADIQFDQSHLTSTPEQASIDVQVKATVVTWIAKDLTVDFN